MGFVLAHCDLVPENVDLQYYLNTMHTRRSAVAPSIDAYSDANTLKGYIIDDEEILDMPIMEDDEWQAAAKAAAKEQGVDGLNSFASSH